MVKVVRETAAYYVVQWSQPEANPTETKINKKKTLYTADEQQSSTRGETSTRWSWTPRASARSVPSTSGEAMKLL